MFENHKVTMYLNNTHMIFFHITNYQTAIDVGQYFNPIC